jgi:membrane-associated phospholipid phosphatase
MRIVSQARWLLVVARQAAVRIAGPVILWMLFPLLLLPYLVLRGSGDELFAAHDIEAWENNFIGSNATRGLQAIKYDRGFGGLDFPAFLMHFSWFFLPFVWSIVVAIRERGKMFEFFCWVLVTCYLSTVVFALVPVRPPWMEDGIHRILAERQFIAYTGVDDNQFAAFPSLHAGLPMTIALFYWLRAKNGRMLGLLIGVHGLLISLAVIYLGEHWVIDVVAGWLFAGGVAVLFRSRRVRRAVDSLPGNPLGQLVAINRYLMNAGARERESPQLPLAIPEQPNRAA